MIESKYSLAREAPLSGGRSGAGHGPMRSLPVFALSLVLLALAVSLSAAEPAESPGTGFLYTRPVAVPAPGWVQVPLDLTTLRHLTPGGDLRVFSPSGREVASRVAPYLPGREGRVEAENAPEPSLAITSREADCSHPSATRTVCRLVLPAAGQVIERLMLDIGGSDGGETGYRLYEPRDARWRLLAEGTWPAGSSQHALDLPPEPVAGDALRLEIYGVAPPAPELKGFSAEVAVETVLFQAEEPGSYLLAYGGGAAGVGARKELPRSARPAGGEVTWRTPAAEQEHPPPLLPAPSVELGNPLGETRFASSWKVVAPEARPGGLVRLELPTGVYGPAHPDLSDLRLAVEGRQIPYLRWTPPAPTLVRETSAQPVRSWDRRGQGGASRIDVDLPQTGLPLTQLLLTAPPRPLRRGLSLRYIEPARPAGDTAEADERLAAHQVWECFSRSPLPCRTALTLSGRAPRLLDLRFDDGDNPPLGTLDLSLWRRSDVLVFVWPERGEVRLLAGARDLKAPDYDLAALGDQLLTRPWRPAEIDRSGVAAPAPRWARWVMPVTLGLAALLLFVLLRRSLAAATP
jgi:hypothetical protein